MLFHFESTLQKKIERTKSILDSKDLHINKRKFNEGKLKGLIELKDNYRNFVQKMQKLYNYPDEPNYLLMELKDASGLFYSKQRAKKKKEDPIDRDI